MYKYVQKYVYTSTEDFNIFKEFFKIVSANLCKSKKNQLFINEESKYSCMKLFLQIADKIII